MQALIDPPPTNERCAVTQALNSPLTLCSLLLSVWAVIGFVGLMRPASIAFVGRTLFPLGALCGAALACVAG